MKFNRFMKLSRVSISLILSFAMLLSMFGCSMAEISDNAELVGDIIDIVGELMVETEQISGPEAISGAEAEAPAGIDRYGYYYSKDDVALYIHTYGELPENFITKDEARDLGWEGGSVEHYLEGAAIGGDVFENREGNLPRAAGRIYYECDIDTNGEDSRGAKRIVFSDDGLIYYTGDHYESFTRLY